MNIVLDCERMKYPNTGLYTFCDKLAVSMQKIITPNDDLTYYIYPKTGKFMGENAKYIERKLLDKFVPVRAKGVDVWHTTYQLSKYTGGDRKTKHILTVHDLNYLYERNTASDIEKYTQKHQRHIDKADYIVAISEFVKKDILEHLDTKGKPVQVIHNGCSLITYEDFDSPNYRPAKPFIFSVATIVPKKNFHILPPILKNNDFELVIAGNLTPYADRIIEEAKRFGVEDRVKILGPISGEEKYWYLKHCLAFAFPSLAEGLGMPVLEAKLFGKPVFLSTLTSLPEIGGPDAYFFENFDPDHIIDVFDKGMEDFDEARSLKLKQHVASFNWDNCAMKYYKAYQSLLK